MRGSETRAECLAVFALLLLAVLAGCSGEADLTVLGGSQLGAAKQIVISDADAEAGCVVVVPLVVSNISGITSADFLVKFDDRILVAQGVRPTSFTQGFVVQPLIEAGSVGITTVGPTLPLISSPFVDIIFQVRSSTSPGDTTRLVIDRAELFDADDRRIDSVRVKSGTFTVR